MEDMEVQEEELASGEYHLALRSVDDQAILDLATDRWPSQVSGDLLGASQLVDLTNQSSPAGSVVDQEGQFDNPKKVGIEQKQENVVVILDEDEPMSAAPSPCTGSLPLPPPPLSTSWIDEVEVEERMLLESLQPEGSSLLERRLRR